MGGGDFAALRDVERAGGDNRLQESEDVSWRQVQVVKNDPPTILDRLDSTLWTVMLVTPCVTVHQ